MDNELLITGAFLGAGLLAYVVIPGLLVMWDRALTTWKTAAQSNDKGRGKFPLPDFFKIQGKSIGLSGLYRFLVKPSWL